MAFALLFYVLREHRKERKEWSDDAREDRRISRAESETRNKNLTDAFRSLEDLIRDKL